MLARILRTFFFLIAAAFSVAVMPAAASLDGVPTGSDVIGTKSVTGNFNLGGVITYTVTLTNVGSGPQADNPGDEFTDALSSSLLANTATASSGTALVNGLHLVTWNGSIPAGGTVIITITANIFSCGVISNQGAISFDADGNGTNESSGVTDDPGTATANDPTTFTVIPAALVAGFKTVSGIPIEGQNITYTVVIMDNVCGPQPDDPASHEFTDTLPASLTLVSASAVGNPGPNGVINAPLPPVPANTVTWDGTIPAGGRVTLTITATVNRGTAGQTISNQGTCFFDSDANGTNDTSRVTDDPTTSEGPDPTTVVAIAGGFGPEIPTLSELGLAVLFLALAGAALLLLRRRRTVRVQS